MVQSSFFDDPHQCWDALKPLLVRILYYCGLSHDELSENNVKVYSLLRSLAAVLYRRRPTLYTDDSIIMEQFRDFITRVSVSFGEIHFWISSDMDDDEIAEIVVTLQGLRIIGLPFVTTIRNPHPDLSKWPFPPNDGVCDAYRRTYSTIAVHQCFAKVDDVVELQRIRNREEQQRVSKVMPPCGMLLSFLNDDTIKHIMTYFNYVDLIRFSSLSKLCNSLACDDFQWHALYRRTYGILGDEDDIQKAIIKAGSWRNLFQDQYSCEKALRFKYNPWGWKHRICGYVGCFQVMRSAERQDKHYSVHEERLAKKRKRQEIIQPRQRMGCKKSKPRKKTKSIET
jgi:hypothetical protein